MAYLLIDPQTKKDFTLEWADFLDAGLSVTSFTWSVLPLGPTLSDQVDAATRSTIYMTGGTVGTVYSLSCLATTDASVPQVVERSIAVRCEQL